MYHDVSWSTVGWIDWIYHNLYDDVQIYIYIYTHRILYTVYIISIYIYIFVYIICMYYYVLIYHDTSTVITWINQQTQTSPWRIMAPSWRPLQYPPPSPRDELKPVLFHWKIGENTGNHWKLWENTGNHWKLWENMGNSLENLGKYGKFIGKSGKIWDIHWKIWENMGNSQKIMGRSCQTHGKII